MRLQLVQLLEGAVKVERVKLVGLYTVSEKRDFNVVIRVVPHGTRARELLDIEEVCPTLRWIVSVFLGVVGQHRRPIRKSGNPVLLNKSGIDSASVYNVVVDGF